jgi:hypothetical protein
MSDQTDIAADRVLSAEEGAEIKQRLAAPRAVKQWRWMGNYEGPTAAAGVANQAPPCVAGEVMFNVNNNGTVAAWMFF